MSRHLEAKEMYQWLRVSTTVRPRTKRGVRISVTDTAKTRACSRQDLSNASPRVQVQQVLSSAVTHALPAAFDERIEVQQADGRFGDYQCNAAMVLYGKHIKRMEPSSQPYVSSHELAQAIANSVRNDQSFSTSHDISTTSLLDTTTSPRVDGPGFINCDVSNAFLSHTAVEFARHGCGVRATLPLAPAAPNATNRQRAIIDYSSPNVAKEMHVGHLRSTVIGDALANAMQECGLSVLRLNHIGDWGTQFGMLIQHLREDEQQHQDGTLDQKILGSASNKTHLDIASLEELYKHAKERFDNDDSGFKARAQNAVVELQSGQPEARSLWRHICDASRAEFQSVYDRLGVAHLEERGESFYNDMVPGVLDELKQKGVAVEDSGALAVFPSEDHGDNPNAQPLIIRKSDGAYSYASTDLAALKHRIETEQADWVVYVTDIGQAGHFESVCSAARRAGWLKENVRVEHAPFGLVLGEDGKRLKTRSGKAVRLAELLDEATSRAKQQLLERDAQSWMEEPELEFAAAVLGIGAVKYADLRNNRKTDYQFSFDAMLDMRGDTAVYLQYAHVRICSVLRKADHDPLHLPEHALANSLSLSTPEERALALHIARYAEAIEDCVTQLAPNRVCAYAYELAEKFTSFYNECRIIGSDAEQERLTLAFATAHTLRQCFRVLGLTPLTRL